MRLSFSLALMLVASNAAAQAPSGNLWNDLKAKREMLAGLHQEFDVTQSYTSSHGTQESRRKLVVDISQDKWRERSVSGSGDRIRIFDGQDLFLLEEGEDEYVRTKRKGKDEDPQPGPYNSTDLDLAKAKELERRPCGFPGTDHTCIILDVPVKKWIRPGSSDQMTRLTDGDARLALDSETGMVVMSNVQAVIESDRSSYRRTMIYSLTKMGYGAAPDAALLRLPEAGLHEVKELSRWNAARIKKQLLGKPAPELEVTDMQGNRVSLASLKGKTVLLDFWTTWCPPCIADAPALDKLYSKYGGKNLMIVGFSMNEDRAVVEKFLKTHPHIFPVILTSENELPRPYQIGIFPTYMVVSPDGMLTTAVEGDQGFGDLRKFLQKAGMDTE
ncbi:MAG: TlpA family protein disulfide reductase [Acidobacteriia bacterium]|nr:TlpA family protein disulfide reductase [Terriglobia bacterium]